MHPAAQCGIFNIEFKRGVTKPRCRLALSLLNVRVDEAELDAAVQASKAVAAAKGTPKAKAVQVDEDDIEEVVVKPKAKPAPVDVDDIEEVIEKPKAKPKAKPAPVDEDDIEDVVEKPKTKPKASNDASDLLGDLDTLLSNKDD